VKNIIRYFICLLCLLMCLVFNYSCTCDPVFTIEVWTVSPEDGAEINDREIALIWNYDYSGSGDITHHVFVGASLDELDLAGTTFDYDTTYFLTSLEPLTTYYWTISISISFEGKNHYEYSDTASFTTTEALWDPGYLHSPNPASGAVDVDSILTMYWSYHNPDDADFDFDVYLGTTIDPPLVDVGLTDSVRSLDTLAGGTTYYWQVISYSVTDMAESDLWHFTTRYAAGEEVFALMEIDAKQAPSGYHVEETIRVRFDTANAPVIPINPLQADSVYCEDVKLDWNALDQNYSYTEFSMPFIENGQPVDFTVFGNADVPSMTTSIMFPACTLSITDPESFEMVSIDGFEVQWNGSGCGETVWLTLMSGTDSTGVFKQVDNDGIDSLTANDLQPLGGQTGIYDLVIFKWIQQSIDEPGYMPPSIIRARAINVMPQINISGS